MRLTGMSKEDQKDYDDAMQSITDFHNEALRKNDRLFKAIKSVKGEKWLMDFQLLLEESEHDIGFLSDPTIEIIDAFEIEEDPIDDGFRFKYYVDQYENGGITGDSYAGYIYVPVKENKFLKFHYSM